MRRHASIAAHSLFADKIPPSVAMAAAASTASPAATEHRPSLRRIIAANETPWYELWDYNSLTATLTRFGPPPTARTDWKLKRLADCIDELTPWIDQPRFQRLRAEVYIEDPCPFYGESRKHWHNKVCKWLQELHGLSEALGINDGGVVLISHAAVDVVASSVVFEHRHAEDDSVR